MFIRMKHLLRPPVFEDEEQTRIADLLNTILLATLAVILVFIILEPFIMPDPWSILMVEVVLVLAVASALFLMRRGQVNLASLLLIFTLWVGITVTTVFLDGLLGSSPLNYISVVIMAGLLLGGRAALTLAGLNTLSGLVMLYLHLHNRFPAPIIPPNPAIAWGKLTANSFMAAILLYLAIRTLNATIECARQQAADLDEGNRRLQEAHISLEARTAELSKANEDLELEVADRKRAEEALQQAHHHLKQHNQLLTQILELGDSLHRNLDVDSLLEKISYFLGFGIAVLNLVDKDGKQVRVRAIAGSDETGRQLLEGAVYTWEEFSNLMQERFRIGRCYFIPAGEFNWEREFQGPVRSVPAGSDDESFDNRWRPEDALLVPLEPRQGQIVGFISVDQPLDGRRPAPDTLLLLEIFASQAASAIENARLYEQAQQEIAHRKKAEEQIKSSLQEKEVLLQEIHHRVKNNLQVISSLLNLQSEYVQDPDVLEAFRDSQNRVRSMALIHEKLYRSQDLARINFAEYIHDLVPYLFRSQNGNARGVTLIVQAEEVLLDIDLAVPCGLLLNELVTNALKHAFPDDRTGEIRIELVSDREGQVNLIVADNGIGLTDEDFHDATSLGLQLVNTLVNQLDGTIELNNNLGTEFMINFNTLQ